MNESVIALVSLGFVGLLLNDKKEEHEYTTQGFTSGTPLGAGFTTGQASALKGGGGQGGSQYGLVDGQQGNYTWKGWRTPGQFKQMGEEDMRVRNIQQEWETIGAEGGGGGLWGHKGGAFFQAGNAYGVGATKKYFRTDSGSGKDSFRHIAPPQVFDTAKINKKMTTEPSKRLTEMPAQYTHLNPMGGSVPTRIPAINTKTFTDKLTKALRSSQDDEICCNRQVEPNMVRDPAMYSIQGYGSRPGLVKKTNQIKLGKIIFPRVDDDIQRNIEVNNINNRVLDNDIAKDIVMASVNNATINKDDKMELL